jgi:hypothetical protein
MSTPLCASLLSIVVLGASLLWVLRPQPALARGAPPSPEEGPWVRRHYATLLCLARGTLNGSVAAFGLVQMGYPSRAALVEGLVAGVLSGSFQRPVLNERFSAYLNRAGGELEKVVRWAWFQAIFYGLVKAAGTLAGGGFADVGALAVAYLATITFGSAQYPWEAAIAASRTVRAEQGVSRDRIRFVADLQTMAVSVTCVGISILNSVGAPHSRAVLLVIGLVGLGHYAVVRQRRDRRWATEAGIVAMVKS